MPPIPKHRGWDQHLRRGTALLLLTLLLLSALTLLFSATGFKRQLDALSWRTRTTRAGPSRNSMSVTGRCCWSCARPFPGCHPGTRPFRPGRWPGFAGPSTSITAESRWSSRPLGHGSVRRPARGTGLAGGQTRCHGPAHRRDGAPRPRGIGRAGRGSARVVRPGAHLVGGRSGLFRARQHRGPRAAARSLCPVPRQGLDHPCADGAVLHPRGAPVARSGTPGAGDRAHRHQRDPGL